LLPEFLSCRDCLEHGLAAKGQGNQVPGGAASASAASAASAAAEQVLQYDGDHGVWQVR
jgi:hypothetical protein